MSEVKLLKQQNSQLIKFVREAQRLHEENEELRDLIAELVAENERLLDFLGDAQAVRDNLIEQQEATSRPGRPPSNRWAAARIAYRLMTEYDAGRTEALNFVLDVKATPIPDEATAKRQDNIGKALDKIRQF